MTQAMITSATEGIIDFAAQADFSTIAKSARQRAAAAIADTIGVAAAGASTEISSILLASLKDAGPLTGAHLLLGTRLTGSALDAALFNGAAAHALDYDDVNHPGPMHPSCHLVPALVALSPFASVSGQDFMDAYIAGFEVDAKLGRLLNPQHYDRGWHATSTIGTVAAAVAGARLLGLNRDAARHCLAIAASSAAGLRGNIGSMTKPLHAGTAARAAVQAVLLARRGFTGSADIVERQHGYLDAFGHDRNAGTAILSELGSVWDLESAFGLGLKPYPCCGEATAAVEAALTLAPQLGDGEIKNVVVTTNERATKILTYPRPTTVEEARFSMPFCVATSIVHGCADLNAFSPAALIDDAVARVMSHVEHNVSDTHRDEREYGASLHIAMADGRTLGHEVPVAKGWERRWLTDAELQAKFVSCTRNYLQESAARQIFDMLMNLDRLPDFAVVLSRLSQH